MEVGIFIFIIFIIIGMFKDTKQVYSYKKQENTFNINTLQVNQQVQALKNNVFYTTIQNSNLTLQEQEKFLQELSIHILQQDKLFWYKNGLQKTLERQQERQGYDYIDFYKKIDSTDIKSDVNYPLREILINIIKESEEKKSYQSKELSNSKIKTYLEKFYFTIE